MAASTYETVMVDVLARLKVSGSGWPSTNAIRRAHRTIVPKEGAPAVHLVDGDSAPDNKGRQCGRRDDGFTVSIFVRNDVIGAAAADPFKIEVMRRLNPSTQEYVAGVKVTPGRITIDTEIADVDAIRVNMDFGLSYQTGSEWSLG